MTTNAVVVEEKCLLENIMAQRLKDVLFASLVIKMLINITDNNCWICGDSGNMTSHHAIPQHLKPKQNFTIPVCRGCHDKIHFDDVNGMFSYIHKIEKTMKDNARNLAVLKKMLDENNKLKSMKAGQKVQL